MGKRRKSLLLWAFSYSIGGKWNGKILANSSSLGYNLLFESLMICICAHVSICVCELWCICVWSCMCVTCVCALCKYVDVHAHAHTREPRRWYLISFSIALHFLTLSQSLSLNQKLTALARLAGQKASGICQFLPYNTKAIWKCSHAWNFTWIL